jgi:hypothetical protein
MWYSGLAFIVAAFVFSDARSRQANSLAWAIGTLLLMAIVLPIYYAVRPLKRGERRKGGRGWNVLRNFALAWTAMMAVAGVAGFLSVAMATASLNSEGERIGAAIGVIAGIGFMGALWFFPVVAAVLLGFMLKENVVEEGPTGPLANGQPITVWQ